MYVSYVPFMRLRETIFLLHEYNLLALDIVAVYSPPDTCQQSTPLVCVVVTC